MQVTELHDWHIAAGAKMAPFAGFDMPIAYPTGALEEHAITRRSVGLFDIDHMGQFSVQGADALAFLSYLVSARLDDLQVGDSRYALLLNEEAGIIDDLFIYRLGAEDWFVVVNAGNRAIDLTHFQVTQKKFARVTFVDKSDELYMLAVQGPRAIELLDALSNGTASKTPRFKSNQLTLNKIPVLFGRTGYTGEDGGELFFASKEARALWEFLLNAGVQLGIEVKPIGLAARDSLRFEAGMPLHGHEIAADINPIEANLKWACDMTKDNFIGKAALEKIITNGTTRKLVTLEVTGGVPREGYTVTDYTGREIGHCVAGMFCPTVKKYAANAFVTTEFAKQGTVLNVVIHNKARPAVVVKRPLYTPAYRKASTV